MDAVLAKESGISEAIGRQIDLDLGRTLRAEFDRVMGSQSEVEKFLAHQKEITGAFSLDSELEKHRQALAMP
jgi:hypothetical protein